MSQIKNGELDQYGAEPFEQQHFGTADVEGANTFYNIHAMSFPDVFWFRMPQVLHGPVSGYQELYNASDLLPGQIM